LPPKANKGASLKVNLKKDRRDLPAYPVAEAARYLRIPTPTLRSWVRGRDYPRGGGIGHFEKLIEPPNNGKILSFNNMIEAHVLKSLRTHHGVSIKEVRTALVYAEQSLGIERLLLSKELLSSAGDVFLSHYGDLINLSKSGQLAMQQMLTVYLRRVERDDRNLPIRLFPFMAPSEEFGQKTVAIDPHVAFGRPVVWSRRITTRVIADRYDAGETVSELAADYELGESEVEGAILYEMAA
jgi:uncharacterized protein (DUF433 family)